jgi:DNA-binding PadR family transcriptional regulator
MYPDSYLPPPLPTQAFYVLFALARAPLHAYAIRSALLNDSLGSVNLARSRVYTLVAHLQNEALIEPIGPKPAGKSSKERMHYTISPHGTLRLKEELRRLNHAVEIAKSAGLMQNDIPTDIQRLLLNVRRGTIKP